MKRKIKILFLRLKVWYQMMRYRGAMDLAGSTSGEMGPFFEAVLERGAAVQKTKAQLQAVLNG